MKKLNRLLALLLVFVFCFALLPVGALAEETDGETAEGEKSILTDEEKKTESVESGSDDEKDVSDDTDEDKKELYAKNVPTGNGQEPQRSGLADEGWYFSFTEGDVSYAIAFYEPWANNTYGLSSGANQEYSPYETTCFSRELSFGVVSKNDQDQATPVDQSFQERITDLTFSFSGTNEDNADGENNWTFAPDAVARRVTITADNKKGFSGTLTASFSFDGEQKELSVPIAYRRSAHYLSFAPEGSEALTGQIQLAPNTPMSGTLYLNSWNAADSAYTAAALTQSESDKFSCEGAVSLSWEESGLATLDPNGTGWFQINYHTNSIWAILSGQVSEDGHGGGGGTPGWYVPVTADSTAYELEFYTEWAGGQYGPYAGGGDNYKPDTPNDFTWELSFGAVRRSDPNDEWGARVLADQSVQNMITDLSFNFVGQNEDGAAGEKNWTFTADTAARRVSFTAPGGKGFSGTLTASFRFNGGEMSTVSAEVHYFRSEAFLSFEPTDSASVNEINMTPDEALIGTLYLNQWNSDSHEYIASALKQTDSAKLSVDGVVSLSWESDLLTITPANEGWFQINYNTESIWANITGNVGSGGGGPGGGGNWRIPVTVEGEPLEIEFYQRMEDGSYDAIRGVRGEFYLPNNPNDCNYEIFFGVMASDDPHDEWSNRTPADENVQNMITDLSFSFTGENEDDAAGQNWTFTPDTETRKVTFSAPSKKGFRGTLTASFTFDGEAKSLSTEVFYLREETYLTFVREGSDVHEPYISLPPDAPLSGTLYLNRWDADEKTYTVTPLTGSDLDTYLKIKDGPKSMKIAWTADGLITFTPDGNDWCYFEYEDRANNIMAGIVVEAGTGGLNIFDSVELIYNGEKINAGPGFLENGVLQIGTGYGDHFDAGSGYAYSFEFVLGALKNYGDVQNETFADPGFFDRILSCTVELDVPADSGVTVSTPQKLAYPELGGAQLFTFTLASEPETPFDLNMTLSFTYCEDSGEVNSYSIDTRVFFEENTDAFADASELDTTDKLNWVLASNENLEKYLDRHPEINFAWSGTLTLQLPPVVYDGLVISNVDGDGQWGVGLVGTESPRGEITTMHGLRDQSGLNFVQEIFFTASPDVTQSWDGTSFTCGVLCPGSEQASLVSTSIYSIMGCSFSGFDYAVRGTSGGYPGSLQSSTFSDCEHGLYIDCPSLKAAGNSNVGGNTFLNCGDAITIAKLPYTITSYRYRVQDNVFINSGRSDIKASQAGTFFCYGNFFGSSFDVRKTAKLIEENGAHIIANPCRESAEKLYGSEYWIDPALPTEILITEAGELLISPVAFTGEKIRIDVVKLAEDDLALQGTWTFGG